MEKKKNKQEKIFEKPVKKLAIAIILTGNSQLNLQCPKGGFENQTYSGFLQKFKEFSSFKVIKMFLAGIPSCQ